MNYTYMDYDRPKNTLTVINIKSDGFDATLIISHEDLPSGIMKMCTYSGIRICFHRLTKTLISLYKSDKHADARLYQHAFDDLLHSWYSEAEIRHLKNNYQANDMIDVIDALLKKGAYKTLRH